MQTKGYQDLDPVLLPAQHCHSVVMIQPVRQQYTTEQLQVTSLTYAGC